MVPSHEAWGELESDLGTVPRKLRFNVAIDEYGLSLYEIM